MKYGLVTLLTTAVLISGAHASVTLDEHVAKIWYWPRAEIVDLDGDGADELIGHRQADLNPMVSFVDHQLQTTSILGFSSNEPVSCVPYFVDINNDGKQEMVFSGRTKNEYHTQIYSTDTGQPQLTLEFDLPLPPDHTGDGVWDGEYRILGALDADGDGQLDLLLRAGTSYDLQPRGLVVYSPSRDSVIGEFTLGPQIMLPVQLVDIDDDSQPEIFVTTHAPANGSESNALVDTVSGAMLFDSDGRLRWHRPLGGVFSVVRAWPLDSMDAACKRGYVLRTEGPGSEDLPEAFCIDLGTGSIIASRAIPARTARDLFFPRRNREWRAQLGLVVCSKTGTMWCLDQDLNITRTLSLPMAARVSELADVDGDGIAELLVDNALDGTVRVYNQDVVELARAQTGMQTSSLRFASLGNDKPGRLLIESSGRITIVDAPGCPIPFIAALDEIVDERIGINALKLSYASPLLDWREHTARRGFNVVLGMLTTPLALGVVLLVLLGIRQFRVSRLRRALTAIPEGMDLAIVSITPHDRVAYMNERARLMLGLQQMSWRNRKADDVFSEASGLRPLALHFCERNTTGQRVRRFVRIHGRARELEVNRLSLPYAGRGLKWRHFVIEEPPHESGQDVTIRWITEINRIMHDLKGVIVDAASSLSHRASANTNTSDAESSATVQEKLDIGLRIIQGAASMAAQPGEMTRVSVDALISQSARYLRMRLFSTTGYELNTNISGDCSELDVSVDRSKWLEAMTILAQNAMESYASREGRVTIRADLATDPDCVRPVRISIIDNGCGISSDILNRVFRDRVTTKAHGAGLGMRIARNIVESFGGAISVQSVVEQGTTVTVELPKCGVAHGE